MKTKRLLSKLGAMFFSAVIIMAGILVMDVAAAEPIGYDVAICGKEVTSEYLSDPSMGWKFTPATGTQKAKLTLTNAHIVYEGDNDPAICSDNALEIVLVGDNYVSSEKGKFSGTIFVTDSLDITGSGTLNVEARNSVKAMYSIGLTVGSASTLCVKAEESSYDENHVAVTSSDKIVVKDGGVLIADGYPSAIAYEFPDGESDEEKLSIGNNVFAGGTNKEEVAIDTYHFERINNYIPFYTGDGIVLNSTRNYATYVHIGPSYSVIVNAGKASDIIGDKIDKSISGVTVTVTADAAPDGKKFDKWVVESGSVALEDAKNPTTSFVMPRGNVKLTAKFSDENGQSDSNKVKTGMVKTVGKVAYKVTASDSKTNCYTVSYMKNTNKKSAVVTVPNTVKIGDKVYKVTSIGKDAFKNNKKLKKVIIGKNVKKIGARAFYGCKKLKSIVVKSKIINSVGKNAFKGVHKKCKIKVPKSKLKKYKKLFKNKGQAKTVKIIK